MFADSTSDDEDRLTDERLHPASLFGYAALLLSDAELLGFPVQGTVEASVETVDRRDFYAHGSETLIRGLPVSQEQTGSVAASRQLRAKDLIAELHAINAQIHHIMFQVERAVSRLATSG